MPTLRKRKNRWQAQVRVAGRQPISRTFSTRSEAVVWARAEEAREPPANLPPRDTDASHSTLGDLLDRYLRDVTPKKGGAAAELGRVRAFLSCPLAPVAAAAITTADIAALRDRRLRHVSGDTVRREMGILRHVFTIAIREWGLLPAINPVSGISMPPAAPCRIRRLSPDEVGSLRRAVSVCRNRVIPAVVWFALATAMRRGEILALRWPDIDLERGLATLRTSKTGEPRVVPLSPEAGTVLASMRGCGSEEVFPVSLNSFRLAWRRIVRRSGIVDLHFHDLRHEAISRFFELGLSTPEVALISGHKSPRMLMRYTHMSAAAIQAKLATVLSSTDGGPAGPTRIFPVVGRLFIQKSQGLRQ